VGQGNALYLIETGVRIGANRALSMGLVQEVVPRGSSLERAKELARHVAGYPQANLRTDRTAALQAYGRDLAAGLEVEATTNEPTLADPELVEGLRRFGSRDRPEPPRG
jgi:enoyl-CoA hydratase